MKRSAKALSIALTLVCLSQVPAAADQLVVFKNGKAMRVKSATKDGKWLKCVFEDKTFLSIPSTQVASIEESVAASTPALKVNQVAAGSGGGGGFNPGVQGIGAGGLPPDIPVPQDDSAQEQAEIAAAVAEEEAARRNGGPQQPNAPFGATSGVTGRRGSRFNPQPGGLQQNGLQPLNQASPFQNRSLTQRGQQSPRTAVPNRGVRATSPTAVPNQNQNQNQEN